MTGKAPAIVDAAVLLPLYGWPDEPGLVFTERRADLRSHAGEISFPGGRRDDGDADLAATALREAEEEIGLDLRPNPAEVETVLTFSLDRLRNGYEMRRLVRRGIPIHTPTYEVEGHLIWGATARILGDLLERLG